MAFHRSNMGSFAPSLADMDGYIPEQGDSPWAFAVDHGAEATHDEDGNLTAYGEWWEEEGFPEWVARCEAATSESADALGEWQDDN